MALRSSKCEVSLSDRIGVDKEGKEITLIDILDTKENFVAEQVELCIQAKMRYGLLGKCLTRREKAVIEMRYDDHRRSERLQRRREYRGHTCQSVVNVSGEQTPCY